MTTANNNTDGRWDMRMAVGGMAAALAIGFLLGWDASLSGDRASWFTTRAAGIAAYLLLTMSVVWGLLTSSRLFIRLVKPPVTLEVHRAFSFIGIGATAVHGTALLFDKVVPYNILQVTLPFLSDYRPLAVAGGIFTAYLMVLLTWSFYVRTKIGGQKVWRAFHYSGFAAFLLATAHGVYSGSDISSVWVRAMFILAGAGVMFLTYVRVLGGRYVPVRAGAVETAAQAQRKAA